MDTEIRKIDPWTLKFPAALERIYAEEQIGLSATVLRPVIIIGIVFFGVVSGLLMAGWVIPNASIDVAPVLLVPLVLMFALALTFSKNLVFWGNLVVSVMVLTLVLAVIWTTRSFPVGLRPFTNGLLLILLLVNAALPYYWLNKACTGLFCIVAFGVAAWHDQIYPPQNFVQVHTQLLIGLGVTLGIGYYLERFVRSQYLLKRELAEEKDRSEALLLNILPKAIADRMKTHKGPLVDSFAEVTVMFADIVGFTRLAESMPPHEVVTLLNELFSRFDASASRLSIEKIKTIGDAYMAVSGLPEPSPEHAWNIADLALELREAVLKYRTLTGHKIGIRIGINSGPVVAGVIGTKKFLYDLWGDTVNVASRMESHGIEGEIQITDATRRLLGDRFEFEDRGMLAIKGGREVHAWVLKRPKLNHPAPQTRDSSSLSGAVRSIV